MNRQRPFPGWLRVAPALVVMAWGGNHFTPLLHMYQDLGDYSVVMVDLFLGMYVLGLVPGLLVAGPLSDRYGRKPLAVVGVLGGIGASALLALGFGSEVVICLGRLLAGLSVGVAMSVGTSWVKELSSPPFDLGTDPTAGARRPSLSLTLGFGIGAGVSGVLAQWGPWPTITPYAVHVVLSVVALVLLASATETIGGHRSTTSLLADLRVPAASHRRFVRVVVPAAPWIFGAAGIAYAVMPQLVVEQTGDLSLAYATLLTVLTLGTGAAVQAFVPAIDRVTRGRALVVGMGLMLVGIVLATANAAVLSPPLGGLAAVTLGAAYGICVVAGLVEVQAVATPTDLAGLTGVYYSLSYVGFLLPVVLAAATALAGYTVLLAVVAVACAGCLVAVARGLRATT
ncbi:MFS transporter [Oerskovia paurometabola]|uniref:MFS transporter n=1 Tax=Oerskovia paurometabola TaxID=162170 RepID=A0ABW1XGH4_9CELL|nr:MFS transporter [Oerskovia paurometabola]MBM7495395.1 MFS family permease [Oerskovia paurometabola]